MSDTETILVIDDNEMIRDMMVAIIGDLAKVETAANGREGLTKALACNPCLITLDLILPDIDGFKVCKALKTDSRTKHIPVILITGADEEEKAETQGFNLGASDFIQKPLKPAIVRARVKTQLELARRERALMTANLELERLASVDALTNCFNRRSFLHIADAELSRMRRHGYAVVVAMVDLDHFKSVNDRFGHATGDAVLTAVASTFKDTVRLEDTVGRFGGEEFAILLPVADAEGANTVLERLRMNVEDLVFTHDAEAFNVTVSIGVSEIYTSDTKIEEALKRADTALYAAKAAGRNQISLARA